MSFSFLYYYSDYRRDLHSFPTRRSSDLALLQELLGDRAKIGQRLEVGRLQQHDRCAVIAGLLKHLLRLLEVRLQQDRKSTRLNSSHGYISYAVFCLKKKTIAGAVPNFAR